jgi:predicted dehydrogenase
MSTDAPIRTAILGNGFARAVMLPGLKHVPEIQVVGIASPNLERAQATAREFGIEQVSADHRELLKSADPELVFVVTPPHRHLEMSRDALMAGCHVVCEKPTALSATESAAMGVAAAGAPQSARGSHPLALIDHELRFDPRRIALREMIKEGRLGDLLHVSYTLTSGGRRDPAGAWSWWSDAAQGGGMWGAVGSHAIDAIRVLAGEVAKVRGRLATFVRERPDPATGKPRPVTSDDFGSAWLELRSGIPATINVSAVDSERRHELVITGSRGFARLEEGKPLLVKEGNGDWREAADDRDLPPSAELGIPDTDWARCFIRYARAIAGAIREGKDHLEGAADFTDGHRNQVVLDAARRSATAGDWVAVPGK